MYEIFETLLEKHGITPYQVYKATGVPQSSLSDWKHGKSKPKYEKLLKIANYFNVSVDYLLGIETKKSPANAEDNNIPFGFQPLPKTYKVPRLGVIPCGQPLECPENISCYDNVPENIKCDFTLIADGDSMINARINSGDIVYIKQQNTAENGQIVAVSIEEETTLKRFYYNDNNTIVLQPENPKYPPLIFIGEQLEEIRILGVAVGFTSLIK